MSLRLAQSMLIRYPKMLGGVKLRIGDQLIDGSVQTKLRRLSESIQSGGSVAIRERFETYIENND